MRKTPQSLALSDLIVWKIHLMFSLEKNTPLYTSKLGKKYASNHRRDGVVVRASASQSVDLGFIPLVESYQKTLKNGIYSFPAWRSAFVENKPASSLVVSLGKALNGMPPPLCGRQVAYKPRKRQLSSECGLPVQSIAIQFAFS